MPRADARRARRADAPSRSTNPASSCTTAAGRPCPGRPMQHMWLRPVAMAVTLTPSRDEPCGQYVGRATPTRCGPIIARRHSARRLIRSPTPRACRPRRGLPRGCAHCRWRPTGPARRHSDPAASTRTVRWDRPAASTGCAAGRRPRGRERARRTIRRSLRSSGQGAERVQPARAAQHHGVWPFGAAGLWVEPPLDTLLPARARHRPQRNFAGEGAAFSARDLLWTVHVASVAVAKIAMAAVAPRAEDGGSRRAPAGAVAACDRAKARGVQRAERKGDDRGAAVRQLHARRRGDGLLERVRAEAQATVVVAAPGDEGTIVQDGRRVAALAVGKARGARKRDGRRERLRGGRHLGSTEAAAPALPTPRVQDTLVGDAQRVRVAAAHLRDADAHERIHSARLLDARRRVVLGMAEPTASVVAKREERPVVEDRERAALLAGAASHGGDGPGQRHRMRQRDGGAR
eukprot:2834886-Prymnesium_polylepis.1